jgi:hypothetical protein
LGATTILIDVMSSLTSPAFMYHDVMLPSGSDALKDGTSTSFTCGALPL